jgi:hypothetical protein
MKPVGRVRWSMPRHRADGGGERITKKAWPGAAIPLVWRGLEPTAHLTMKEILLFATMILTLAASAARGLETSSPYLNVSPDYRSFIPRTTRHLPRSRMRFLQWSCPRKTEF